MNDSESRKRRCPRLLLAAPLLLAGVLGLAAPPLAHATTFYKKVNSTEPLNFVTTDTCTGEQVLVSGTAHEVFDVIVDNAGGYHMVLTDNWQDVSGVGGTGGTLYRVPMTYHTVSNGRIGTESTKIETWNFISQGSAPNFDIHLVFHYTFNPDGTLTAYHDSFTADCRG